MTFLQLFSEIEKAKATNPRLFMLDADEPASDRQIAQAEHTLGVLLPECYKQFVKAFGGGYFGLSLVYSLDEIGDFCLLRCNTAESVARYGYVAVIDFENGDMAGFRVENDRCSEQLWHYDHESGQLEELPYENLFAFLAENALHK